MKAPTFLKSRFVQCNVISAHQTLALSDIESSKFSRINVSAMHRKICRKNTFAIDYSKLQLFSHPRFRIPTRIRTMIQIIENSRLTGCALSAFQLSHRTGWLIGTGPNRAKPNRATGQDVRTGQPGKIYEPGNRAKREPGKVLNRAKMRTGRALRRDCEPGSLANRANRARCACLE